MLRFFRQIRQRLLPIAIRTDNPTDQARRAGKFSKYLLYALKRNDYARFQMDIG